MIVKATKQDAAEAAGLAAMMWDASFEELTADFEQHVSSNEDAAFLYVLADKTVGFAHCCLCHDYVEGTDSCPVGLS